MVSSRESILQAIRKNKPAATPLPERVPSIRPQRELEVYFSQVVISGGGAVFRAGEASIDEILRMTYPDALTVASTTAHFGARTLDLHELSDPHELASVDLFVCEGELGVAENGAIWVSESELVHRAAAFITQHLAIVLDRNRIVWQLQEAYDLLAVNRDGYGVFIAGPSKTADIEQSLILGAHGPRSLTVILR